MRIDGIDRRIHHRIIENVGPYDRLHAGDSDSVAQDLTGHALPTLLIHTSDQFAA